MPKTIQFKLDFDQDLEGYFKTKFPEFKEYRILSKSLDARGAPRGKKPVYHFILEAIKDGEAFSKFTESESSITRPEKRPIFIGAGPAGLFGALRLVEKGVPCIVIERGEEAHKRMLAISKYWRRGELDTESNVCFGEGGAGLFSDGKLITRVKSPLVKYVMQKFVDFGAPPETAYISNPHLGSNKIRALIGKISSYLKDNGCEFYYNTRVDELIYDEGKVVGVKLSNGEELFSDHVILAAGHSAKELYHHLNENQVALSQKDFAVGVRIEHPRSLIDSIQHGRFASELEAARYKLTHHEKSTEKGTYSFCMCPGGYVLSSGTDEGAIVINGMSNFARNSPWSNSALVVSVKAGRDFPAGNPLSGLEFQESIEKKAYAVSKELASGRELPAMTVSEFLNGKLNNKELPKTSCPSKLVKADIRKIFPKFISEHLRDALKEFNRKMKGYSGEEAVLIAPETRTSAPITILRDKKSLESTSHKGLYPCGEGAGYAGGITSAAVDGIKVADSILEG
ncbi:MAG: NAD(P)/FAD-dependent oxidoreductase [Bacteriovoracaceae bacterium]|nr:NAD(P)/FAD-dependent oxidoreductase [Bacteriovoracaceae bacterium]